MSKDQLKIEKDIMVPPPRRKWTPIRETFVKLRVGESFFVPNSLFAARAITAQSTAAVALFRYRGQFRCRTVDGGVRIWRTSNAPGPVSAFGEV
jgi:uncharacterized protein (DUF2249 family)